MQDQDNRSTIGLPRLDDIRMLSLRAQLLLGLGITVILRGSLFLAGSLIVFAAIIGACLCFAITRSPGASLISFVVMNVVITIRTKNTVEGGAPSVLDLALGVLVIGVFAYWIVKLRLIERETISNSIGQLCITLFICWSIFVTALGLFDEHNVLLDAFKELLNLSMLLILPLLYFRFVKSGSKLEYGIFFSFI